MEYYYKLTRHDLRKLGIKPTKAYNYAITQSGWTGDFNSLWECIKNHGVTVKGKCMILGKHLTHEQQQYIMTQCCCIEW